MTRVIVLAKSSEVSTFVQLPRGLPNKGTNTPHTWDVLSPGSMRSRLAGPFSPHTCSWPLRSDQAQPPSAETVLRPGPTCPQPPGVPPRPLRGSEPPPASALRSLQGFYHLLPPGAPGPPSPPSQVLSSPAPFLLGSNTLPQPEARVTLPLRAETQARQGGREKRGAQSFLP